MVSFDPDILDNKPQEEMDKKLAVKFFKKAVYQRAESEREGRQIFKDVDYISIKIPGDSHTIVEHKATDEDKRRFSKIWEAYVERNENIQSGIPLEMLPGISPAQVQNYRGHNIYTIEQLSGLSERIIQKIAGSREWVEKANVFLKGNNENQELKNMIAELQQKIKQLESKEDNSNVPIINNPERDQRNPTRGRPRNSDRK